MAKRYIFVRMPEETFNMFYNKKIKMERDIKEVTGKNIPMPMTRVFKLIAQNPIEVDIDYLADFAKRKRRLKL